jgi:hypothetical protein
MKKSVKTIQIRGTQTFHLFPLIADLNKQDDSSGKIYVLYSEGGKLDFRSHIQTKITEELVAFFSHFKI